MTVTDRSLLIRQALDMSLSVREAAGVSLGTPLNVFDLCERATTPVRVLFVDYSMEACYLRSDRPLIQVSALRPQARRVFNCAHELGHHAFGHGSTIDELRDDEGTPASVHPNEIVADAFAGYLLMPRVAVRRAFSTRSWSPTTASPAQVYVVACHFGVGYTTLVNHLTYALREITTARAKTLLRATLRDVRRMILGSDVASRLVVADHHYALPTLDVEVGTHLLLPPGAAPETAVSTTPLGDLASGRLLRADRPGIVRVEAGGDWAVVVRVSAYQYSGWSQYRHFEQEPDDHA